MRRGQEVQKSGSIEIEIRIEAIRWILSFLLLFQVY